MYVCDPSRIDASLLQHLALECLCLGCVDLAASNWRFLQPVRAPVEARAENDELVDAGDVPLQSRIVEGRPGSRLMLHRGYALIGVVVDPRHVAGQAVYQ